MRGRVSTQTIKCAKPGGNPSLHIVLIRREFDRRVLLEVDLRLSPSFLPLSPHPSLSSLLAFISPGLFTLVTLSTTPPPPSNMRTSTFALAAAVLAGSAAAQSGYGRFPCTIVNGDGSFSPGTLDFSLLITQHSSPRRVGFSNFLPSRRPDPVRQRQPRCPRCQRRLRYGSLSCLRVESS